MQLLKTIFAYFLILSATFWIIGFIVFCAFAIGIKYRPLEQAEAIVVLTGGSDRISKAIHLLQENHAPKLFISGVGTTESHLLKEIPPKIKEKIELGYWAKTTRMNAIETAKWISENKIASVILVTSFYHMPRSLLEIKEEIPHLKITPYAVFPQAFGESTDWLHTRYAWQLFLEYHKFLVVYFFKGVVQ